MGELVPRTRWVFDRGQRPIARGIGHLIGALVGLVGGTVLSTYAWMTLPWAEALSVTIYAVGVVVLFGISAAYHRGEWKSKRTVDWWRRADHATIAIFIAATYTPLCVIAIPSSPWLLWVAWVGALVAVLLNFVWIEHPRWVDVVVYLALGWIVIPLIPELWRSQGATVVLLLGAGGVMYTLGAVIYGLRWPGRHARIYGYHEHFHTATIVAAIFHMVAIWIVVVI